MEESRPSLPKGWPSVTQSVEGVRHGWQAVCGSYERMQECSWVAEADTERSELCDGRALRDRSLARLTGQPVDVDVGALDEVREGRCRGTHAAAKLLASAGKLSPHLGSRTPPLAPAQRHPQPRRSERPHLCTRSIPPLTAPRRLPPRRGTLVLSHGRVIPFATHSGRHQRK